MQKLSRRRSGNRARAGLNPGISLPPSAIPGTAPLQGPPWAGSAPGLETSREGVAGAGELEGQPADRRRSLGAWALGNRRQ